MGTRVALVACTNSTDGAWSVAKGNELELKVTNLGKGEHITLFMEIGELSESVNYYEAGVFPIPWKRMERYRVGKHVGTGVKPLSTSVEIVLNGNASSIRRYADDSERGDRQ